jgi:hypothetical protein
VDRYRIQRKIGDSLDQYAYFTIGETDLSTLSFLDNSISENIEYSYRVGICEGPLQGINSYPIFLITEPVPVELTAFYSLVSKNNVTLYWETATETNNYGFEILRFNPSIVNEWKTIGFVPGHGTTTEKQSYSFSDEMKQAGKFQYRLKQIDFDGSFELSQILEINFKSPTIFSLEQNYPNPFNPITLINYSIKKSGFVLLKIYDVLGNEVADLVNGNKSAGYYSVEFNAAYLPSGIYFYTLTSGNYSATKKFLLLK